MRADDGLPGTEPTLEPHFVAYVVHDGRRFRLVVVADFSRECLALVVDNSLSGRRVARVENLRDFGLDGHDDAPVGPDGALDVLAGVVDVGAEPQPTPWSRR